MNKEQIVGKTIKWSSGEKEKIGEVIGVIPRLHDVMEGFPFLANVPVSRWQLGSFRSSNYRLLVKVTTATGLEKYYGPLVPVANVKKDIWLPKDAKVIE